MGEFFEFKNIEKYYGDVHVVKNVSFGVRCGEVFSLLGPSGCGKTTMLRIAGGFEDPESGEVFLDSVNITDLAPNKRKINTVFQNYALFPPFEHLGQHRLRSENCGYARRPSF